MNIGPTIYADMAKAANDIPTPKPVHQEPKSEKPKPPESAQANKMSEHAQTTQLVLFAPQTQELTVLMNSLSNLITSFKKVMARKLTIEKRQENMETVLEKQQQANEK